MRLRRCNLTLRWWSTHPCNLTLQLLLNSYFIL